MKKSCRTCKYFRVPEWVFETTDEDFLGDCEWPTENLPYSLRYANRERTMVEPTDGAECSGWTQIR